MAIISNSGFSAQWENAYATGGHRSIWPWTDLVILVNRYAKPANYANKRPTVLEIGFGAGANIPFLTDMGFEYHGIEGSGTAVNMCRQRYPNLTNNLIQGDFSKNLVFHKKFDLIVDRASLSCNTQPSIENTLHLIHEGLSENGRFISVTLYSRKHPLSMKGEPLGKGDPFTRTNYTIGTFKEIGWVHFFDRPHIEEIFSEFSILHLEHIAKNIETGNAEDGTAYWNLVASKS